MRSSSNSGKWFRTHCLKFRRTRRRSRYLRCSVNTLTWWTKPSCSTVWNRRCTLTQKAYSFTKRPIRWWWLTRRTSSTKFTRKTKSRDSTACRFVNNAISWFSTAIKSPCTNVPICTTKTVFPRIKINAESVLSSRLDKFLMNNTPCMIWRSSKPIKKSPPWKSLRWIPRFSNRSRQLLFQKRKNKSKRLIPSIVVLLSRNSWRKTNRNSTSSEKTTTRIYQNTNDELPIFSINFSYFYYS